MIKFIKDFKTLIPEVVQLTLLIVISVYVLAFLPNFNLSFFSVVGDLLPFVLIVASTILLALKKKYLAAHLVLLLGIFLNAFTAFAVSLFSVNFNPFSYTPGFSAESFVNLFIFFYLTLIVVSYLLVGGLNTKIVRGETLLIIIIAGAFIIIFNGIAAAVFAILLPILVLMFGYEFPAILVLLAMFINIPFDFISDLINGFLGSRNLIYYITFIASCFIIYLIVIRMAKLIKANKI